MQSHMIPGAAEGSERGAFVTFWGKTRYDGAGALLWHPIAHHLLDVAAALEALITARPVTAARTARLLGLTEADAIRLLVALAALHDLGKFAPSFQGKVPDLWPGVLGPLGSVRLLPGRHTEEGYLVWAQLLADRLENRIWPGGRGVLDALGPGVFGHHGRPIACSVVERERLRWRWPEPALEAALTCATAVLDLVLDRPVAGEPPVLRAAKRASWWVAGLVVLADWVGSRERWWNWGRAPFDGSKEALRGYWTDARERAARAVAGEGLATPRAGPPHGFVALTGQASPTGAQRWAEQVDLPEGPLLVILEDATGSGKTEAAQMLVHRLIGAGRVTGAYWAMPTQATANAMYLRQREVLPRLFAEGAHPSLVLAHGMARLHDQFRGSVIGVEEGRALTPEDRVAEPDEPSSQVACAAFFADDGRAAMLADLGAGTVDQALLSILPTRFNALRLLGLADKVLVVDEAHAYDAYMGIELQELLRFQAALGGSAIVLSATLAAAQRRSLIEAWVSGLDAGAQRAARSHLEPWAPDQVPYPLGTVVGRGPEVHQDAIRAATWCSRTVPVRLTDSADDVIEHLARSAGRGAAAAWIRNTVDECLASADGLRSRGVEAIVFHARFAHGDRQRCEAEVLRRFGRRATATERAAQVLVATQVIEQSLDLDFDVMVTDLAPVDLVIQRAGRLWRHGERERPEGIACELLVFSPRTDVSPDADWLERVLPGTAWVYPHAGVLWRTAQLLSREGEIRAPGGLRHLIEGVYGSDDTPPALLSAAHRAAGEDRAAAETANIATLKVNDGYHGDARAWVDELRARTRLSDVPMTTVRLGRVVDGRILPWERGAAPAWRAWALSEVQVRSTRVPLRAVAEPSYHAAVSCARAEWGRFDQEIPLLPLVEERLGVWRGVLLDPERNRRIECRYTPNLGLAFG